MDRNGCLPGYFSDALVDNGPYCSSSILQWIISVSIFLAFRATLAPFSFYVWHKLYSRNSHLKTRGYCFGMRIPIIPSIISATVILSLLFWILGTLNIANFNNGHSIILVGLYFTFQLFLQYLEFRRVVKIGLKIVPILRTHRNSMVRRQTNSLNQTRLQSSKKADSVKFESADQRNIENSSVLNPSQSILEENLDTHKSTILENGLGSQELQNKLTKPAPFMKSPSLDSVLHVAATGIYLEAIRSHSYDAEDFSPINSNQDFVATDDTNTLDVPLKLLFFLSFLCTITGILAAIIGINLKVNKDTVLLVLCISIAGAQILTAIMLYWQIHRNLVALERLKKKQLLLNIVEAEKLLKRQGLISFLMGLLYAIGILFLAFGESFYRPWWVILLLDATVTFHNYILLFMYYWKFVQKRKKIREKLQKTTYQFHDYRKRRKGEIINDSRNGQQSVPELQYFTKSEDSSGGASRNLSSLGAIAPAVGGVDIPSYEEAWNQGFRWRRWSSDFEKERRAFIAEYKNWLRKQDNIS